MLREKDRPAKQHMHTVKIMSRVNKDRNRLLYW